ncbi:hypothetical protein LUZ60_012879 [Juncus effusus]|nr:hypothetical protein LUZ60_012879 [Juncus effusus]
MEIASCNLDGNADAVEFCPHDQFHNILAAATYTLQEQQQSNGDSSSYRTGSISLFSVSNTGVADTDLRLLHRENTAGIFDMKWSPVNESFGNYPLLALADADGFLTVRKLESESASPNNKVNLKEVCTEKISTCMCLYVDWRNSLDCISVSHSDGSISLISFKESELKVTQNWQAHQFEAWTTTFDLFNPHLLYSGSDDCRFSCWDTRQNPSEPVFNNSKSHTMGVCCISQSSFNSNILYTGSYDESMRVWDMRLSSKPVNQKSICLGGGVWRVKPHPCFEDLVLAACMHNGFAILRINGENVDVLERYEKHESLAYGADWKKGDIDGSNNGNGSVVATCSFYDRLLRVWQPECLKN